jgi:hypothetical protein
VDTGIELIVDASTETLKENKETAIEVSKKVRLVVNVE